MVNFGWWSAGREEAETEEVLRERDQKGHNTLKLNLILPIDLI